MDVLRGVVMFLMLFVNDIGSVGSVPWWLKHYYPDLANGMTIVDVVFPAFLFVVGMSVPVALERRRAKGEGAGRLLLHVWLRTVGLLVMGVMMVNFRGWGWWPVLAIGAMLLGFGSVKGWPGWLNGVVRGIGFAAMGMLAWWYSWFQPGEVFGPQWWGILGLIAWAYLVAGMGYILLRGSVPGLVALVGVLVGLFFADAQHQFADWFHSGILLPVSAWIDIGPMIGSHGAVAVLGTIVGVGLVRGGGREATRVAGWIVAGAGLAGLVVYPSFGVNKNLATPAWAVWSAGLTAAGFICVRWVCSREPADRYTSRDGGGRTRARSFLATVGANALLLYLLQPLWFRLWSLLGGSYGALAPNQWMAYGRAVSAVMLLSGVAWGIGRLGVRFRV